MLDPAGKKCNLHPAGKKCNLHIRAAGIFVMQLKLLETQRFAALCHNEAAIVDEERVLATAQRSQVAQETFLGWMLFAFTVVPQAELCTRTDSAGTADNYAKEFAQKMLRRIHAQFPT